MNILNTITPELSKINYANDVLTAIAYGIKKNNDLVNKSHASSSASISNCLNKLLKLDLIEKMTPINDETNKKKTMYKIKNNSLAFYYKYIKI